MKLNAAVTLGGGAMAASYFLPWIGGAFAVGAGGSLVPHDVFTPVIKDLPGDAPLELYAFLATFVLGALAAIFALFNAASRLLTFLAGAGPFALLAWMYFNIKDAAASTGLPLQLPDNVSFGDMFDLFRNIAELGLWAYLGGALILLILAIFDGG